MGASSYLAQDRYGYGSLLSCFYDVLAYSYYYVLFMNIH